MASTMYRMTFLVITFTHALTGIESAFKITTAPSRYNELTHKKLQVTCIADGPLDSGDKVVNMYITRHGQERPLVNVDLQQTFTWGRNRKNMVANGGIQNNDGRNILSLTIKNPGIGDAGSYRCGMNVLRRNYELKQETATKHVTFYGMTQQINELQNDSIKKHQDLESLIGIFQQQNDTIHQHEKLLQNIYKRACREKGWLFYGVDFTCLKVFGTGGKDKPCDWYDASVDCREKYHGDLVIIRDAHKNTFVHKMLIESGVKNSWFGLKNVGGRNDYVYKYVDKTPIGSYSPWATHVFHHRDRCVMMKVNKTEISGKWDRSICREKRSYICSVPPNTMFLNEGDN